MWACVSRMGDATNKLQEEIEQLLPGSHRDHRLANDCDSARRAARVRPFQACVSLCHVSGQETQSVARLVAMES